MNKIAFLFLTLVFFVLSHSALGQDFSTDSEPTKTFDVTSNSSKSFPADKALATFTVDSTGDAGDATPGDGICATAGGACTLRAAVQESNTQAGA